MTNFKKTFILSGLIALFGNFLLQAQPGTLDSTFSGDGKLIINLNPEGGSFATCVAAQPDGKVVMGGIAWPANNDNDFALARFNNDGSLDSTFGSGGIVLTDLNSTLDWIAAIAIQPDGKIIATGHCYDANSSIVVATARYNADGTLDYSFGSQGIVTTKLALLSEATSLVLQSDGKIVVAGYVQIGNKNSICFIRYNADGTLDPTFSQDGKNIHDLGFFGSRIRAIDLQADGKFVATGYSRFDNMGIKQSFFISRYNTDGSIDNSFGTGGIIHNDFSAEPGSSDSYAIRVQPDGKIIVAGAHSTMDTSFTYYWALARFNTDGTFDDSFGSNGRVTTSIPQRIGGVNSLVLQPDGKIIAAGRVRTTDYSDHYFAMVRYHIDGTLDNTFGEEGIQTNSAYEGVSDDYVNGVTLQPDGKIVAVGDVDIDIFHHAGIVRYLTDLHVGVFNYSTLQNSALLYPNPILKSATLQYTLVQREKISVQLYDLDGKLLKTLLSDEEQAAGDHKLSIILPDALHAGTYILTLTSPKNRISVKVLKRGL